MWKAFVATWLLSILPLTTSRSSVRRPGGEEYIVLLDENATAVPRVAEVLSRIDLHEEHLNVRYIYNNTAFQGFAATIRSNRYLDLLSNMSDISHIEKASANNDFSSFAIVARRNVPWGLQRISSTFRFTAGEEKSFGLDFSYHYFTKLAPSSPGVVYPGAGVDIYIVDSGVLVEHDTLHPRAKTLWSFNNNPTDNNDHGTRVASVTAGKHIGVADSANVWSVKVKEPFIPGETAGSFKLSDVIIGIDQVIRHHEYRSTLDDFRGSVMTIPWGSMKPRPATEHVIARALQAGIHTVIAAGNYRRDACFVSPAKLGGLHSDAITVGAMAVSGYWEISSNRGSCIDVLAPGQNVYTAKVDDTKQAMAYGSGTSLAAPHIAGLVAYLLALDPSMRLDVGGMKRRVKHLSKPMWWRHKGVPQGVLVGYNGVWDDYWRDYTYEPFMGTLYPQSPRIQEEGEWR